MKINVNEYDGRDHVYELSDFIAAKFKDRYADGKIETLEYAADKMGKVLGGLINLLVDKKIITLEEVGDNIINLALIEGT